MAAFAPSAIRSSKESFQQFRKVAMEKEERERARKLQLEAGRERNGSDKSRWGGISGPALSFCGL